jgi:hypothetical protein
MSVAVYLEVAPKPTFAGALYWRGWCRSGRTESAALDALVAYGERYAAVVPGMTSFSPPGDAAELDIVERLTGDATTEFGAPGKQPEADQRSLDQAELQRQAALLEAAWGALDAASAAAQGHELRKGPRGGGRELLPIAWHVLGAEQSYLSRLGARHRLNEAAEPHEEAARLRARVLETLAARALDEPIPEASSVRKLWTPRYFVRRAAWHVLDHAWEIEDRMTPSR